jgi:hypothetical protein
LFFEGKSFKKKKMKGKGLNKYIYIYNDENFKLKNDPLYLFIWIFSFIASNLLFLGFYHSFDILYVINYLLYILFCLVDRCYDRV